MLVFYGDGDGGKTWANIINYIYQYYSNQLVIKQYRPPTTQFMLSSHKANDRTLLPQDQSLAQAMERVHAAYLEALLLRVIYVDMAGACDQQNQQALKAKIINALKNKLNAHDTKETASMIGQAYQRASASNYQAMSAIQTQVEAVIVDLLLNDSHQQQYSQFSLASDSQSRHEAHGRTIQHGNSLALQVLLDMSNIQQTQHKNNIATQTDCQQEQYTNQMPQNGCLSQQTNATHSQQQQHQQQYGYVDAYLQSLGTCRHEINILCQHMKYRPVQYMRYMHDSKYYVQATVQVNTSLQLNYYAAEGWSSNYKQACEQAAYGLLRKIYVDLPGVWRKFMHVKRVKRIL